jgi:hypothetical protein
LPKKILKQLFKRLYKKVSDIQFSSAFGAQVFCLMVLCVLVAFYMCVKDYRSQSIPIWSLFLWVILSTAYACCGYNRLYESAKSYGVFAVCTLIILCYQLTRSKSVIGNADLIILFTLAPFLSVWMIPYFLILCGAWVLLFSVCLKTQKIPFLPSLFLALIFVNLYSMLANSI